MAEEKIVNVKKEEEGGLELKIAALERRIAELEKKAKPTTGAGFTRVNCALQTSGMDA